MSVYPETGVGLEQILSTFDDQDAKIYRYREALLREYPDALLDVQVATDENGTTTVTAVGVDGKAPQSLSELLAGVGTVDELATELTQLGLVLEIKSGDFPSILDVCAAQATLLNMKDAAGAPIPMYVAPNASSGQIVVHVSEKYVGEAMKAAGESARWLSIEPVEDIVDAGRYNDTAPWYGGSRIVTIDGGGGCTTSFRVGGPYGGMLTADHCPGPYYHNGTLVGTKSSSLASAKVDAVLAVGSSYGNRVWTGGTSTTTSISANGIYRLIRIQGVVGL